MVLELLGPNLEVGNFNCFLCLFNSCMDVDVKHMLQNLNILLCSGPFQPVWEKIQHKNCFAYWDPACFENGNDPLQWINIQVSAS